jgi:hypothetical protein
MTQAIMTDLLRKLQRQLDQFDRRHDHRAAFLRVYTHMTRRVTTRLDGHFFLDPRWIARVAVRFADMYFAALAAYDTGGKAPPAWHLAFDCARRKRCFLLQDIVLGVNAHINNDLPQVLCAILREEGDWGDSGRMLRRRYDHDQINRILHEIIPAVEGEAAQHYGRLVAVMGWAMGTLDQTLGAFGLKQFRDNTWRNARFLLAAADAGEEASVREWVEQDALFVGKLVHRYSALSGTRPLAGITRRLRLF